MRWKEFGENGYVGMDVLTTLPSAPRRWDLSVEMEWVNTSCGELGVAVVGSLLLDDISATENNT